MENTSGQGKAATIPPELGRWNWGAFLLNWIWGLGNRTYIALLALVPVVGLVMAFVVGFKGNAWAWRNKQWESVEHFKRVQRKWTIAALILTALMVIVVLALAILGFDMSGMHEDSADIRKIGAPTTAAPRSAPAAVDPVRATKKSPFADPHQLAISHLQKDDHARTVLGSPANAGPPMGSVEETDDAGKARFAFSVDGPQGRGVVTVNAERAGGKWTIVRQTLQLKGSGEVRVIGVPAEAAPRTAAAGVTPAAPATRVAAAKDAPPSPAKESAKDVAAKPAPAPVAATGKAAAPPAPESAKRAASPMPAPAASRAPPPDADARACLEQGSDAAIARCAEQYR